MKAVTSVIEKIKKVVEILDPFIKGIQFFLEGIATAIGSVMNVFKGFDLEKDKKSKGFGDTFEKIMIFTGIKRLIKGKPKEATAKVGREVIRSGKRGRNMIKKVKPSGLFPPMK